MLLKIGKAIGLTVLFAVISHAIAFLLLIVIPGVAAALFVSPLVILSCVLILGSAIWSIVAIFLPLEKAGE
jgi:hypothetical protein